MPNATISFDERIPQNVEIIPVVYVLNDCLQYNTPNLGTNIVDRIIQINETNDIHGVKCIQIDCDWTVHTQNAYFALLKEIRKEALKHHIELSVTIRLHQLSMPAPPADCGTLMLYNTGDVRDSQCSNPILQLKDVAPYLKYLTTYTLPMNIAYPIFSWRLLYRNGHFVGFMHGNDIETYPGDKIITLACSADEVMKVKSAINNERKDINNNVIIYSLDKNNIKRYDNEDIDRIFSH